MKLSVLANLYGNKTLEEMLQLLTSARCALCGDLRSGGCDLVFSTKHGDSLMSVAEGRQKSAAFLHGSLIRDPKPGSMSRA